MLAFNDDSAAMVAGGAISSSSTGGGPGTADDEATYQLPPPGSSHNSWKILVYDVPCQRIISPLLNVQQLRRRGVTLHLLLHSDREAIPDVPAVYFCRPTRENLARIARDCAQNLYGRFHVNLVTRLDRAVMEEFAKLVVQSGSLGSIASIHDQYLDYVVLERNLFSLSVPNSYQLYNGGSTTEAQMEAAMSDVALGLFSVVASLGQVPVIRCPKVSRSGCHCHLPNPVVVFRDLCNTFNVTLLFCSRDSSWLPNHIVFNLAIRTKNPADTAILHFLTLLNS
jgi:hypothetical protein